MSQHIDPIRETRRQRYLETLYARSGRTNGLYTGLMVRHMQALLEEDMKRVLDEESRRMEFGR